jgi:hypothetical protein
MARSIFPLPSGGERRRSILVPIQIPTIQRRAGSSITAHESHHLPPLSAPAGGGVRSSSTKPIIERSNATVPGMSGDDGTARIRKSIHCRMSGFHRTSRALRRQTPLSAHPTSAGMRGDLIRAAPSNANPIRRRAISMEGTRSTRATRTAGDQTRSDQPHGLRHNQERSTASRIKAGSSVRRITTRTEGGDRKTCRTQEAPTSCPP